MTSHPTISATDVSPPAPIPSVVSYLVRTLTVSTLHDDRETPRHGWGSGLLSSGPSPIVLGLSHRHTSSCILRRHFPVSDGHHWTVPSWPPLSTGSGKKDGTLPDGYEGNRFGVNFGLSFSLTGVPYRPTRVVPPPSTPPLSLWVASTVYPSSWWSSNTSF